MCGASAFIVLARQRGITIDAGIDVQGDQRAGRTVPMLFQPSAASPVSYSKHHLVPGFERQYTAVTGYTSLGNAPRIGLAIYKEMDFQDVGYAYAMRDAIAVGTGPGLQHRRLVAKHKPEQLCQVTVFQGIIAIQVAPMI